MDTLTSKFRVVFMWVGGVLRRMGVAANLLQ